MGHREADLNEDIISSNVDTVSFREYLMCALAENCIEAKRKMHINIKER